MLGAGPRDEFGFHIDCSRARFLRKPFSLFRRSDHLRRGDKIDNVRRNTSQGGTKFECRVVFRDYEIAHDQLVGKSAGKTGADQVIELLATANPSCGGSILEKKRDSLPADAFSDAGVKKLDRVIVDLPTDRANPVSIVMSYLLEKTPKARAFRR